MVDTKTVAGSPKFTVLPDGDFLMSPRGLGTNIVEIEVPSFKRAGVMSPLHDKLSARAPPPRGDDLMKHVLENETVHAMRAEAFKVARQMKARVFGEEMVEQAANQRHEAAATITEKALALQLRAAEAASKAAAAIAEKVRRAEEESAKVDAAKAKLKAQEEAAAAAKAQLLGRLDAASARRALLVEDRVRTAVSLQSPRPARVLNQALGFGVSTPAVSSTRDSVSPVEAEAEEAVEEAEADSSAPASVAAVLPVAVALSVAAVACIVGGLYAWTELPTMMGWSEPAPPPVVSWYDSVVDSVVELWS